MITDRNYPFLDGLRGVSIIWIMYHHVEYFLLNIARPQGFWRDLAQSGHWGVNMFFVISGFLITDFFMKNTIDPPLMKKFYVRRFSKIMPQYVFFLCTAIVFYYFIVFFYREYLGFIRNQSKTAFLPYFFFLQNFTVYLPLVAHLWSIAVEEHFYLTYPWLLYWLSGRKKAPGALNISVAVVLAAAIILVNVIKIVCDHLVQQGFSFPFIYQQSTFYCFDSLLFGCLINVTLGVWKTRRAQKTLGIAGFFVGMAIWYWLVSHAQIRAWFSFTLAYVATGLLIISSLCEFRPLKFFLELKFLRWIGQKSYGIYLWHYLLIWVWFMFFKPHMDAPLSVLTYCLASITFGWLTTDTLERYFIKRREELFNRN